MSDLIERYDAEHNVFHGVTPDRRTRSLRVLAEFEEVCGGDLLAAGPSELKRYISRLQSQGVSMGTLRQRVGLVRPFYTWARENGLIDHEQIADLKAVRMPRGIDAARMGTPRPYSRDEVAQLWVELDEQYPFASENALHKFAAGAGFRKQTAKHARRLQIECVLALTLFGAMRRDEVWRLTLETMSPLNAYVTCLGAAKNEDGDHRVRIVPWTTPEMKQMVADWLEFRAWLEPTHQSPWLSLHNTPTYRNPMNKTRFNELLIELGSGWSFHRMRHTAITEMLRAGYPLHEVRRIAGHSRIAQTLAYTETLPEDLVRTANSRGAELSSALSPRIAA